MAILTHVTIPEVINSSGDARALARPYHINWPSHGGLHVSRMQISDHIEKNI